MPFKSTEIRWFSTDRGLLWDLYHRLPTEGEGTREQDRTDYYLRSNLHNTGIKVREGNHECKLKSGPDEPLGYGVVEQWVKWSTREEQTILHTIAPQFLGDWIGLEKTRYKKKYEVTDQQQVVFTDAEFVADGCGVECTRLYVQALDLTYYTFGLEAFGTRRSSRDNLQTVLRGLPVDFSRLKPLDSFGYPMFLSRLPAS